MPGRLVRRIVFFNILTAIALVLIACSNPNHRGEDWRRMVFYPADLGVTVAWRADITHRDLSDYLEFEPLEDGIVGASPRAVFVGGRKGVLHKFNRFTGESLGKLKIGEEIFSQPVVHGDTVYLGTSAGYMLALSTADLREKWRYKVKAEIIATPVYNDGIIYFIGQDDTLTALHAADGKFAWEQHEDYSTKMQIRRHAAPVIDGETLYQGFTNGSICAFNKVSGERIWCRNLGSGARFDEVNATPIVKNGFLYTASFDNGVFCLNAQTGITIWKTKVKSASSPVYANNLLYLTASDDGFYFLDPETGKIVGHYDMRKIHREQEEGAFSRPLLYKDRYLVFSTSAGGIYFYNYLDDRFIQRFTPGNGISAPPTVAGELVFALSNGGSVYAIALGRKGSPFAPFNKP